MDTKRMPTGLRDKNGVLIYIGDTTELLVDGEIRRFSVEYKTAVRKIVNHPTFVKGTSKVAITGVVFCWNGFDLFPCVDQAGVPDNEKMTIVKHRDEREGAQ